jgi:hypothetical protein
MTHDYGAATKEEAEYLKEGRCGARDNGFQCAMWNGHGGPHRTPLNPRAFQLPNEEPALSEMGDTLADTLDELAAIAAGAGPKIEGLITSARTQLATLLARLAGAQ